MKTRLGLALVFAAFALAACGRVETFDYHPPSEIPPGPGIVTGEQGSYTIYRR